MTLNHLLNPKHNNLDLFRLIAALLVIYGHAPAFVASNGSKDIVALLLGFDYSGSLAVKFFFMLSGLLVTASLLAKPVMTDFLAKRAARIFPGLWVCLGVTVFVVGPFFTQLSIPAYIGNGQTWNYLVHNAFLYPMEWRLPGVFDESKHGINGSLWTLPLEVSCYLFLAAFYFIGVWYKQWLATAGLLVIVAISFYFPTFLPPLFGANHESTLLPGCFAIGALLALYQTQIKVDIRGLVALVLLAALLWSTEAKALVFYVSFFYACLYVASLPVVVRTLKLPADPSYGVYIYGFVIQQIVAHFFPARGIHFNQVFSALIALGVGMLSWRYIEKPAIQAMRTILMKKDEWMQQAGRLSWVQLVRLEPQALLRHPGMVLLAFVSIAWLMHFIALYFIFPGYYHPLSFQHSDFYIPASFAYSPSDNMSFMGLLSWPRPLFMWYYKFSGFFGHAGSVAWVVLIVFINCAMTALLLRRFLNIKLDLRFAGYFALYTFLLFSQPYFYTFYSQDIGSQLSYLLLILGVAGIFAWHETHPVWMFVWGLLCSACAFLVKETYILSFGFLAFVWCMYFVRQDVRKALIPGVSIVLGAALSFMVGAINKSIFVNVNARQGSDYEIQLNIASVLKELFRYGKEAITPLLIITLCIMGYLLYKHRRAYFGYFGVFLLFALLAWLPNAVLPNHHYEGYSFNGLYLCFASLFLLAKMVQERGQVTKAVWIIIALAVLSPITSIKAFHGARNSWVLGQEAIQTNMLKSFTAATSQLPLDRETKVLVTGITSPFHPFVFPESMRSFPHGEKAHYFVALVGADTSRIGKTMDLVTYIEPKDQSSIDYDQEWRFDDAGHLVAIKPHPLPAETPAQNN